MSEDLGIVLVVLTGSDLRIGGLNIVGSITEMVDLAVLRDAPSGLCGGDPVCGFPLSVHIEGP